MSINDAVRFHVKYLSGDRYTVTASCQPLLLPRSLDFQLARTSCLFVDLGQPRAAGEPHISGSRPETHFPCFAWGRGQHEGLWLWKPFLQQSLATPWQPALNVRKELFFLIHFWLEVYLVSQSHCSLKSKASEMLLVLFIQPSICLLLMTWSPGNPDPGAATDAEWHATRSQQRAPTPHLLLRRGWGGGKAPGRGKTLRCQMGKENGDLGQIQDRETSSSYGEWLSEFFFSVQWGTFLDEYILFRDENGKGSQSLLNVASFLFLFFTCGSSRTYWK